MRRLNQDNRMKQLSEENQNLTIQIQNIQNNYSTLQIRFQNLDAENRQLREKASGDVKLGNKSKQNEE